MLISLVPGESFADNAEELPVAAEPAVEIIDDTATAGDPVSSSEDPDSGDGEGGEASDAADESDAPALPESDGEPEDDQTQEESHELHDDPSEQTEPEDAEPTEQDEPEDGESEDADAADDTAEDPVYDLHFDDDDWYIAGDAEADVESRAEWAATLYGVVLSGNWSEDLLSVAISQIGYHESTENYALNADGKQNGYTRYGDWSGVPYGDWSAMFVAWCLHYAGVKSAVFPRRSDAHSWVSALRSRAMFEYPGEYVPQPGDLVFFDEDQDGRCDHVGIVQTADPVTGTLLSIQGDSNDQVEYVTSQLIDPCLVGYGVLPYHEGEEDETEENPGEESGTNPDEPDAENEDGNENEESAENGEESETQTDMVRVPTTLTKTVGDQTVTVQGLLPEGAELNVVALPFETAAVIYSAQTGERTRANEMLFAFDIYISVGGEKYDLELFGDTLSVSVSNAANEESDRLDVLHVMVDASDGSEGLDTQVLSELMNGPAEKESIEAETEGNAVVFELSSCSVYLGKGGPAEGTLQYIINLASDGDVITLEKDYDENIVIPSDLSVSIDFNGHRIRPVGENQPATCVLVDGNLTLLDSAGNGGIFGNSAIANTQGAMVVGTLSMEGGSISGFTVKGSAGGGVFVSDKGKFIFSGGTVSDNSSDELGGGIYSVSTSGLSLGSAAIIENNSAKNGGGLAFGNGGSISLSSGTVRNNSATTNGGGLYFNGAATVEMSGSFLLSDNHADANGGGAWLSASSKLTLSGAVISANSAGVCTDSSRAAGYGGGLYLDTKSELILNSGLLQANTAYPTGGGAYLGSSSSAVSTFTMTGGEICGNSVSRNTSEVSYAGGVYIGSSAKTTISGGKIHNNTAVRGAGLYFNSANTVAISGGEFYENVIDWGGMDTGHGGGFYAPNNNHVFTISGGEFYNNSGTGTVTGGGFRIDGGNSKLTMTGGTVHDNTVGSTYGGFYCGGTTDLYNNVKIYHNTAGNNGGGIGGATVNLHDDVEVSDNVSNANAWHYGGGGIYATTLTLNDRVRIENNRSGGSGGGVFCTWLLINDSEAAIENNTATSYGGGVIVYNGQVRMLGGSVSGNRSSNAGGGLYVYGKAGYTNVFSGGTIENNKAVNGSGGGIAFGQNPAADAEITGNIRIVNNSTGYVNTDAGGGGVYVGTNYTLTVSGGVISGNYTASRGGGIYFYNYSTHLNVTGGVIADNEANNYGNDIAGKSGDTAKHEYPRGAMVICAAGDMSGNYVNPYWHDEINGDDILTAIDNREDMAALTAANSTATRTYGYTFIYSMDEVAQIDQTVYGTLQSAFDAIKDGTATGTDILLLKDTKEGIILPEGIVATLDLNGHTVRGVEQVVETQNDDETVTKTYYGSVFYIPYNSSLTVDDTSAEGSGTVTGGRGVRGVQTSNNNTVRLGGGFFVNGTLVLKNGTITGNMGSGAYANGSGGGVYVNRGGTFIMEGGLITGNTNTGVTMRNAYLDDTSFGAPAGAGGATVEIRGGEISDNERGGIYARGSAADRLIISGGQIKNHTKSSSVSGGGVYLYGATFEMSGGEISSNRVTNGSGAGLYLDSCKNALISGDALISDNELVINNTSSYNGGGIYCTSTNLTITGGRIINNKCDGNGGGIYYNWVSSFVMSGGEISGNSCDGAGGGIYFYIPLKVQITGGKITDNRSLGSGGGIYYNGYWYDSSGGSPISFDVADCEITGNSSGYSGGGICISQTNASCVTFGLGSGTRLYGNDSGRMGNELYYPEGSRVKVILPAEDMGNGYVAWRNDSDSTFYTRDNNGDLHESTANSDGSYPAGKDYYLTAVKTIEPLSAVARIGATTYPSINAAILSAADGDRIYLLTDVTESISVAADKTVTLDLNGYTVSADNGKGIVMSAGSSFTLDDTSDQPDHKEGGQGTLKPTADAPAGRGVTMATGCTFILNNGTISGFGGVTNGGGIFMYNNCSVEINGGSLEYCSATGSGGGIYAANSYSGYSIKITGGRIYKCSCASGYGGAVYLFNNGSQTEHSFIMTGGEIRENEALKGSGGGLALAPQQTAKSNVISITGGSVVGNSAASGGGIYIWESNNATDQTTVEIRNLTVEDNHAVNGAYGGMNIATHKSITIEDCVIRNNTAQTTVGGMQAVAYASYEHSMTVNNVLVEGNYAVNGYGGAHFGGNTTISELRVLNNSARGNVSNSYFCGGLSLAAGSGANLVASNITVDGNQLLYGLYGGGVRISTEGGGSITVRDSSIVNNSVNVSGRGGGVYIHYFNNANSHVTFDNCIIKHNESSMGGGIYCDGGSNGAILDILDCEISENISRGTGGGIAALEFSSATMNVEGTRISGNRTGTGSSSHGGGIYAFRTLNASNARNGVINLGSGTVIENNTVTNGSGGGVYSQAVKLNLDGAVIRGNTASVCGGGIYQYCNDMTMSSGSIENNTVLTDSGGGLIVTTSGSAYASTFTMTGGSITGNAANGTPTGSSYAGSGGGIYVGQYVTAEVSGGVITGNVANGRGGGVCTATTQVSFELKDNGKLYGNSAGLGQDLYARYSSSAAQSRIDLLTASDMFDASDSKKGIAWWDEQRDNTYENGFHYALVREYPLTLQYTDETHIVAVIETEEGTKEFPSVQEAVNYIELNSLSGKTVKMVDDSLENVSIPTQVELTLNLNGHTLQGRQSAITCAGSLIIEDEKADGDVTSGSGTGTISGNAVSYGGGVHVISGGNVVMNSGQIANCRASVNVTNSAYGGAGVCCDGGSFTLNGGSIRNNKTSYGGGVYVRASGAFIMNGGTLSENKAYESGGAIYNAGGSVVISAGVIEKNEAKYGAGICTVAAGRTNIDGGDSAAVEIRDNSASTYGGGIYNAGVLNIANAKILRNSTPLSKQAQNSSSISYSGGGLYVGGGTTTILAGTVITGNTAGRGAGISCNGGKVYMTDGKVYDNTALLGGGVYQNPLSRNEFYFTGGQVYANHSSSTSTGNDFYSFYEGSGDYPGTRSESTLPRLSVQAAVMMHNPNYSVWRDDKYDGANLSEVYEEGRYVSGAINVVRNVLLTASNYPQQVLEAKDVDAVVRELSISSGTAGETAFSTGDGYFDTSAVEVYAEELLQSGEASEAADTYTYNGTEYHYISYGGKLYERDQAVSWEPGNDTTTDNTVIRTYDRVTYKLTANIGFVAEEGESPSPDQTKNVDLGIEIILPCSEDEASFGDLSSTGLVYSVVPKVIDGKPCQVLRGYYENEEITEGTNLTKTFSIRVKNMKNGETIRPEFKMWIVGNQDNTDHPAQCKSKTLTVSALGKYNVTLLNNSEMTYTSYFNLETGLEASAADYDKAVSEGKSNIVYGTMLGYGLTVELYNTMANDGKGTTNKGLRGVELPTNGLEFDVNLKGALFLDGTVLLDGNGDPIEHAPYIWAYKENENTSTGRPLGASSGSVMMNWNDEDDLTSTTRRAFNAAPYNYNNGPTAASNAVYNGGGWLMTGSQPGAGDKETTVHVRVAGYLFDDMSNSYPSRPDNNIADSDYWKAANIKPFTAGYVQVIFPFDRENAINNSGYMAVQMEAAATDLSISSRSGLPVASSQTGLDALNLYFDDHAVTDAHATNEITYLDNYSSTQHGFYILGSDGNGDYTEATNYYTNEDHGVISGSAGNGSTPLMSKVFIGSTVNYYSKEYRTDDPVEFPEQYIPDAEFDPVRDNKVEYNYMTAMNLLQKFDGDVFTPLTGTIVNQRYNLGGTRNDTQNFRITTTETATTWSERSPYKTMSYTLTVLYAAKPDGSNWVKEIHPDGTDDGGAADMLNYREENLVYYTSLAQLQADGKVCVAILYEFRDMCIRTHRRISVEAMMQTTSDFQYTGNTYATTHDVRSWSTYRPTYKEKYADGSLSSILYNHSWQGSTSPALPSGQIYIKLPGDAPKKPADYVENSAYWGPYWNSNYNVMSERFTCTPYRFDGYVKTQFKNGSQIGGTHNGWYSGNSVLLYTQNSEIAIMNEDYELGSGNSVRKTNYDVNEDRVATFKVTPKLSIASSVLKTSELLYSTQQGTRVSIELTIPKGLSYREGSLVFDYSKSAYKETDLTWSVSDLTLNPDGSSSISLVTYVSDVSKALPTFSYSTKIGDEWDNSKDVHHGDRLTTTAEIHTTYEEDDVMASTSHTSQVTIGIIKNEKDALYLDVEKILTEVNENIGFILNYRNFNNSTVEDVQLLDVLPYNGDGRGTSFHGGYRISELAIEFSSEQSYQSFLADGGRLAIANAKQTVPEDTKDAREALLSAVAANESSLSIVSRDDTRHMLTFAPGDAAAGMLTTLATERSAAALRAYFPNISPEGAVRIYVRLSPFTEDGGTTLIPSGGNTRTGGDVYHDDFYYRTQEGIPTISREKYVRTVSRGISGFVWMDMDQDGLFTASDDGTKLQNITVRVMKKDGENWVQATDILGNELKTTTDSSGAYSFRNMAEGEYTVRFSDPANAYLYKGAAGPLPFGKLSVTALIANDLTANANRSVAEYQTVPGLAELQSASLYKTVTLPAIDQIPTWRYLSTNWNCGLYYINAGLEKQWSKVVGDLPDDASATFALVGKVDGTPVMTADYTLQKTAYSPTVTGASYSTAGKTTDPATGLSTYTWTLSSIPMQAETADAGGNAVKIEYSFTETGSSAVRQFESPVCSVSFENGITTFRAENPTKLSWLDLQKLVEGNLGDKTKQFNFTVEVKGVGNATVVTEGDLSSVQFKNSKASVSLKHGQHVKIPLPAGAEYTVTENGVFAYVVTHATDGAAAVSGRSTNGVIGEAGTSIVYTNRLEVTLPTGIALTWGAPMGLCVAGLLGLLSLRRRRKKD